MWTVSTVALIFLCPEFRIVSEALLRSAVAELRRAKVELRGVEPRSGEGRNQAFYMFSIALVFVIKQAALPADLTLSLLSICSC